MDTINNFLDVMFAPYLASTRPTDAKAELRAMMEDVYVDALASGATHNEAAGCVITDFGSPQEIVPVPSIANDLTAAEKAPQPEAAPVSAGAEGVGAPNRSRITLPEAQKLIEVRRREAASLGLGVVVLASTGIPLFMFRGLSEAGLVPFDRDITTFLALAIGLPLVALGVTMLLTRSRLFTSVKYLVNLELMPDPIVTAWAARLRLEYEGRRIWYFAIAAGPQICVALPLVAVQALPPIGVGMGVLTGADNGTLSGDDLSELVLALSVVLMVLGLWIFLPANWIVQTQQALIRDGCQEYDHGEEDNRDPTIGTAASVYWPCAVVAHFAWGAILNQRNKS